MDKEYEQLLPFNKHVNVIKQFGFCPFSVIKPTKESKAKWENVAYFNDGEIDERKGYGIRDEDGIAKMSEFHAGVAENIIKYWSLPGARVVDPFAGRVTRAVISTRLNRQYYGYEITPNTYNRSLTHFKKIGISPVLYLKDGTKLSSTEDDFADLVFTCPPYFDIEKYESVKGQLSDIHNYKKFMKVINKTVSNCFRVLKNGGFCVWVVADFRKNGELVPFHSDVIASFVDVGFSNHDCIIMENITPFSAMQLEKVAAKRYTSKIHEFILVFRKPGDYIIPQYCQTELDKIDKKKRLMENEFFS